MDIQENLLIEKEMVFSGGLGCRGCGWSLMARHISDILGEETVYVVPACCFSIIAGPYPFNLMKGTIVHSLFAAAAATASGVRAGLDKKGKHNATVAVLAGDGGTFDIGLQALSGAASRDENILYICNNNGAYMNTGIQSSSATPMGAITTTNPQDGHKQTWQKDLIRIVAAHHVPYIATASLAHLEDMRTKIKKARDTKGFRLLMIDGTCPPGHKIEPEATINVARLAVDSNLYPLYEVENGKYTINYFPKETIPVRECLKPQGRFSHLFKKDDEDMLGRIQQWVDKTWKQLNTFAQHN